MPCRLHGILDNTNGLLNRDQQGFHLIADRTNSTYQHENGIDLKHGRGNHQSCKNNQKDVEYREEHVKDNGYEQATNDNNRQNNTYDNEVALCTLHTVPPNIVELI